MVERSRAVAALVAGKLLLHLGTIGLYPLHRDEIYLLACGQRLAWGSPDHAPLAPALARAGEGIGALGGHREIGPRIVAAFAGAATVWLAARMARRLAGERAAVVTAAATLVAPVLLFYGGVYCTGSIEAPFWAAACERFVAAVQHERGRGNGPGAGWRWALVGLALGVGMLAKHTVALCGVGLFVGLAASDERALLGRRGPWIAAATALAVLAPELVWQATHGAPALAFGASSHAAIVQRFSPLTVLATQPALLHPMGFALAVVGIAVGLWDRAAGGAPRALAVALLVAVAIVAAAPGKPYYPAPAYLPAIAIGAGPAAAWLERRRRWAASWWALWLVAGAVAFALTVPALPLPLALRLGIDRVNGELPQFADWHSVAADVARAARGDGRVRVLTDSYGTAAAIERYGPSLGLALAPASGANSYFMWGPPADAEDAEGDALLVLGYPDAILDALCARRTVAGTVAPPHGLDNRYDFPRTIWRCEGGRSRMRALWPELRRYD